MRRITITALVTLACAGAVSAQSTLRGPSPGDIARAFFDAATAEQWMDAARWLDTTGIGRERQQMMRNLRRAPRFEQRMTVEELVKLDSTMPRAVAEYQVAQMERARAAYQTESPFRYMYARIKDTTEYKSLSTLDLAARWLEAQDPLYSRRTAPPQPLPQGCTPEMMAAAYPRPKYDVMGSVERPDTAYVIFRDVTYGTGEMLLLFGPRVLTLIRKPEGWLIYRGEVLRNSNVSSMIVSCGEPTGSGGRPRPPS